MLMAKEPVMNTMLFLLEKACLSPIAVSTWSSLVLDAFLILKLFL